MSEHVSWSRIHPGRLRLHLLNNVEAVIPVPGEVISPCHGNSRKRLYPVAGAYFAWPLGSAPLMRRTGFRVALEIYNGYETAGIKEEWKALTFNALLPKTHF